MFWGKVEKTPVNTSAVIDENVVEENAIQLVKKNYVQPLNTKWVLDKSNGDGNISASTDFMLHLQPSDPSTLLSWTIQSPTDLGGTLQIDIKFDKVWKYEDYSCEYLM